MDRREAMLRELNLYPQWQRRVNSEAGGHPAASDLRGKEHGQSAPVAVVQHVHEEPKTVPAAPLGSTQHRREEARDAAEEAVASAPSTGSGRTEVDDVWADSSVATSAAQVGKLDWSGLKQQVHDCQLCPLRAGCMQTVFGTGDQNADWLFVGEAPGADEDALNEPFVGQAGKLLDNMLAAIKLERGRNVYIANVIKCRPADDRHPHVGEIAQCLPYLRRQIELIQPKLIVALGKTAAAALLGQDATIASLRGTLHDYHGIPLVVTYHPAYLLRSPLEKAKAWQDLCLAVATHEANA